MKGANAVRVDPESAWDRASRNIFICHSGREAHFIPLLEALLDVHDHRSIAASGDEDADARLEQRIERAVLESDAVVLVLTRGSVIRPWMTREIAAFHATKPRAPVLPLLLEPMDHDRVGAGLGRFPAIDFSASMLGGFEKLFAVLGNRFLSKIELRDRRSLEQNRREGSDRRRSTVEQRMQMGLLLQYCRATDQSVFEQQVISLRELTVLTTALQEEARRYEYFDADGLPVDALEALDRSVLEAWRRMGGEEEEIARVVKTIAEEICSLYVVRAVERRRGERRNRPQGAAAPRNKT